MENLVNYIKYRILKHTLRDKTIKERVLTRIEKESKCWRVIPESQDFMASLFVAISSNHRHENPMFPLVPAKN